MLSKIVTIRSFLLFLPFRCSFSIKKKYRRGTNIKIFYWKKNFLFTSFFKYWFIHFFIGFMCRILFTITCFHPFFIDSDHPFLIAKTLCNVLLYCLFNLLLQNCITFFLVVVLASGRSISKDDWLSDLEKEKAPAGDEVWKSFSNIALNRRFIWRYK